MKKLSIFVLALSMSLSVAFGALDKEHRQIKDAAVNKYVEPAATTMTSLWDATSGEYHVLEFVTVSGGGNAGWVSVLIEDPAETNTTLNRISVLANTTEHLDIYIPSALSGTINVWASVADIAVGAEGYSAE